MAVMYNSPHTQEVLFDTILHNYKEFIYDHKGMFNANVMLVVSTTRISHSCVIVSVIK
jgi:hypothetical protein